MRDECAFQTTVEAPAHGLCLIRVAGRLDQAAAANVLRLVDAQLELVACRRRTITDLVIDIEAVSSVDSAGLEAMRHPARNTDRRGIDLHISGCGGRVRLLPLRTQQLLTRFRTFPTAEAAVAALTRGTGPDRTGIEDRTHHPAAVPCPRPSRDDRAPVDGPGWVPVDAGPVSSRKRGGGPVPTVPGG